MEIKSNNISINDILNSTSIFLNNGTTFFNNANNFLLSNEDTFTMMLNLVINYCNLLDYVLKMVNIILGILC